MKKTKELALDLLNEIRNKEAAYRKINKQIKAIQGDFAFYMHITDPSLEDKIINLLDEILGDELASYFIYDCGRESGMIEAFGHKFPIRNIDDVKKYMEFLEKNKI